MLMAMTFYELRGEKENCYRMMHTRVHVEDMSVTCAGERERLDHRNETDGMVLRHPRHTATGDNKLKRMLQIDIS